MKIIFNRIFFAIITAIFIGLVTGCPQKTDKYQGYVETKLRYISCDYSGVLTNLFVLSGDDVKTNDKLFVIDQFLEQKRLETSKENIAIAQEKITQMQSLLTLAGKELVRLHSLVAKKFTSQESVDIAETTYKTSLSQLEQAESDLKNNKTDLNSAQWIYDKKHVDAMIDAQVFDTFYNEGEFVPAGHPVLALLVPEDIRIIFFIPEKELGKVKLGQNILIDCDGCKNPLKAKISYISSQPQFTPPVIFSQDTSSKLVFSIEARADIETSKKLHPGQPVIINLN